LYYQYIPEGKEYPVLCRKLETERSGWMKTFLFWHGVTRSKSEEVLLDWNELAERYGKLVKSGYVVQIQVQYDMDMDFFFEIQDTKRLTYINKI
jgi:protease II